MTLALAVSVVAHDAVPPASPFSLRLADGPDLPLARSHVIELGQIVDGSSETLVLTLTNQTQHLYAIGLFGSSRGVKLAWDVNERGAPANVRHLGARSAGTWRVVLSANKQDGDLPAIILTTPQGLLSRIIVHAVIRSAASYTVSQSQYMASRTGDQWGNYYAICSGPPPYGYVMDKGSTSIRVHEHWEGYGARNCDKGMSLSADNQWTRCTTVRDDENGVCYAVSIQCYKADVQRIQHAWEYLTVRWILKTQPPELR